jgi:8-oxo-dGTP pyrophosphatase MutT (NUDIX family)
MGAVPEVGGIVFPESGGTPQVLLVRARKDPRHWIFPKGHLEPGEAPDAAVLREAHEKAGVGGKLVGPVGAPLEFVSGPEPVRVQYYLVRATTDRASPERRDKRWLTLEDALGQLSFEDSRQLLRTAVPEIERQLGTESPQSGRGEENRLERLLLAEYAHIAESMLRNEEDGERRVTFFITLTGAVGAAVAFAVGKDGALEASRRDPVIILVLVALLALGYLTFLRIVSRNVASDRYKRRLARVRRYFLTGPSDDRRRFLRFDPFRPEFRRRASWRGIVRGGWFETVAMIDALLFGALAGTLAAVATPWLVLGARGWLLSGFLGLIASAVSWTFLIAHGNERYRQQTWDPPDGLVKERSALGAIDPLGPERLARVTKLARRYLDQVKFTESAEASAPAQRRDPYRAPADEVLCLLEGALTVVDVEREETVDLRPGDVLFIPAGIVHRVESGSEARCIVARRVR